MKIELVRTKKRNKHGHLPNGTTWILLERKGGMVYTCFVDTNDYPRVAPYRWHCKMDRGDTIYANTTSKRINGKQNTVTMHRLLLPGKHPEIDHWDHNGLNNTRENLRAATGIQNQGNSRRDKPHSSIYRSVSWCKRSNKFVARIIRKHQRIHLGLFDTEYEAAKARDAAASLEYGEFAILNFPAVSPAKIGMSDFKKVA